LSPYSKILILKFFYILAIAGYFVKLFLIFFPEVGIVGKEFLGESKIHWSPPEREVKKVPVTFSWIKKYLSLFH